MFLDGGGSLLFVSGELGMYRGTGWVSDPDDFFGRYLHTMYLGDSEVLQYGGVSGTPLAGMSFVQQETVADEGECVWPVGSDVEPILEWPTTIPSWGGDVSAAHVTGVAALLRGTRPDLSAADVRTRLLATAEKLPQFRGKCLSEGRLDAYRALAETTVVDPAAHQTALTVGVSSSAPAYGTKAAITGQVTQAGVPLRNVTVGLQELRAGVFEVVQVASTGETGQYRFEVGPSTSTVYRVTVRPIGHLTFAPSATRLVKPKTSISLPRHRLRCGVGRYSRSQGFSGRVTRRGRLRSESGATGTSRAAGSFKKGSTQSIATLPTGTRGTA